MPQLRHSCLSLVPRTISHPTYCNYCSLTQSIFTRTSLTALFHIWRCSCSTVFRTRWKEATVQGCNRMLALNWLPSIWARLLGWATPAKWQPMECLCGHFCLLCGVTMKSWADMIVARTLLSCVVGIYSLSGWRIHSSARTYYRRTSAAMVIWITCLTFFIVIA